MPSVDLELNQISKTFDGGIEAIRNLTAQFSNGDFISVLGPSGCGKSTLLRLISNLDQPTTGILKWSTPQAPRISYVFQDASLLAWKSVYENIALPLRLSNQPEAVVADRVNAALSKVKLTDFTDAYPAQLSGGMKMRVSLCRALVNEPQVLLLDEPFAALDEFTRQELDDELRLLWTKSGMTIVFVTHSISEAAFLSNRCLILTKRPATLIADLKSGLPATRTAALKLTTEFLVEVRKLSEAFREN